VKNVLFMEKARKSPLTCVLLKKNKSSNSKCFAFAPISLQPLKFLLMGGVKIFVVPWRKVPLLRQCLQS